MERSQIFIQCFHYFGQISTKIGMYWITFVNLITNAITH